MKVSVIVPVHNPGKYLAKCLKSLAEQTMQDFEIICVDDGSTDGSDAVLAEFAARDRRLRVLTTAHNGAAKARNAGMEAAAGDYLYFCDADDWLRNDLLGKMVETADREESDIVVAGIHHYDERTKRIYRIWKVQKSVDFPCAAAAFGPEAFSTFQWSVWNKLFRKSFIDGLGLRFQDIPRTNDIFFVNVAIAEARRISLSGSCYYYRHNHGDNIGSLRDRYPYAVFEACAALRGYLVGRGLFDGLSAAYVNMAIDAAGNLLRGLQVAASFSGVRQRIVDEFLPLAGITPEVAAGLPASSPQKEKYDAIVSGDMQYMKYLQSALQGELVRTHGRLVKATAEADASAKALKAAEARLAEAGDRTRSLEEECARLAKRPHNLRGAVSKWFKREIGF